jgi:hypothetical protein
MADFEIIDASDAPAALRRTGPNERAYEALVAAGPGKVLKVPMAGKKPDSFISRMHFLAKKRGRKIRCRQVECPINTFPPPTPRGCWARAARG